MKFIKFDSYPVVGFCIDFCVETLLFLLLLLLLCNFFVLSRILGLLGFSNPFCVSEFPFRPAHKKVHFLSLIWKVLID